jgi:CAAX prenyl protease-like protein
MESILGKLRGSPLAARVVPFVIFAALTSCQGFFGEAGKYWFYVAKTLIGAWLIWAIWPVVSEMRWTLSWEAVFVGVAIFALWVSLDPYYPKFTKADKPWNPFAFFGVGTGLAWLILVVRIVGSALVVPPLEELFYRSFVYRYIIKPDFTTVSLGTFHPVSLVATSAVFGAVHREWLAGIVCGLAYQWLVVRKGRLGDAMTAHAITNFLLGGWVVYKGAWHFW